MTHDVIWGEIRGFQSPGEHARFVRCIEDHVRSGHARELVVDPDYGRGEIYGGRWFEDLRTGAMWRLVPPDFPFRGVWVRVTRDKDAAARETSG
jgi:hypothetical protein